MHRWRLVWVVVGAALMAAGAGAQEGFNACTMQCKTDLDGCRAACSDSDKPQQCRNECNSTNTACRRDCQQTLASCRADCADAYQEDVTEPSDCFPCRIGDPSCTADCPGLDDAIAGEQDCLDCLAGGCSDNGNSFFNMCTAQCASPKPGVCALNLTCVRGCRIQAGGKQQQCRNRFRQQVRGTCALVACGGDPNYFRTAKQVRNQCDKACKKGLDAATPAVATLPGTALQSTRGCNCQQQCIRTIVGGCFNQCVVACRGDNDALRLCNNACRNAQCASLRQNCASDSANPSISYSACCEQCSAVGGCDNDLDAETLCTPTTSTTTTTNTTLSTTTTTIAGQTTTSSTSTTTLF